MVHKSGLEMDLFSGSIMWKPFWGQDCVSKLGLHFWSPLGPPSDMRRKSRKRMALSTSLTPLSIAQFALPPTVYTML